MQKRSPSVDPAWLAYVEDPAWLPYFYDPRADTLVFAHLPRETQRRVVFLDPRFIASAPKSPPAPVSTLPLDLIAESAGPIHFIFHTAFCCSTLLTRVLDIPGVSMGVKEPSALASLAMYWATGRRAPGGLPALGVTLDLLSRPLAPAETQIVKASNVVNHIVPSILHLRPDAKAIVMHSSLDSFLRGVAIRGVDGRLFARRTFAQFATAAPLDVTFSAEELFEQTDLQIAAQAWLMQAAFLSAVAKRFGPSRVRTLNADTFLAEKAKTLSKVADFFDLRLDGEACARLAEAPVFKEHAKQPLIPFDAEKHKAQQDKIGASHFDELNTVRAWAKHLAEGCGAPLTLGDTLLAP